MKLSIVFVVIALTIASVNPALSAGRIVVADDDWTLSDTGFAAPNDPGVFATNVAAWFTGGSAGNFLAYSNNFGLTGQQLRNAMTSAGHTWTVSTAGTLDLAELHSYDGVFLSVTYSTHVSASALTEYIRTGGNIYLYAGAGQVNDPAPWNAFLGNFGLKYAPSYNPLVENTPISSSHPILAGVDHLYRYNGNDITDLDPDAPENEVIAYSGTHGIIAVYDGSLVPEPSSLLALAVGLTGLAGVLRRRSA